MGGDGWIEQLCFFEVVRFSGPFQLGGLLVGAVFALLFVIRAFRKRGVADGVQAALTDGMLFGSVVAIALLLLLIGMGLMVQGLIAQGIDADWVLRLAFREVVAFSQFFGALILLMLGAWGVSRVIGRRVKE